MFEAGCQLRLLWNHGLEKLFLVSQYVLVFLRSWGMGSAPGVREKKNLYGPFGLSLGSHTA